MEVAIMVAIVVVFLVIMYSKYTAPRRRQDRALKEEFEVMEDRAEADRAARRAEEAQRAAWARRSQR